MRDDGQDAHGRRVPVGAGQKYRFKSMPAYSEAT
jgi:hypothetical protein